MIFTDILEEKSNLLGPEIDRLFDIAWKNQSHIGDLLLLHINGFYQDDILIWNNNPKNKRFNPHVIGPGYEGHSEFAHYKFIDKYRTTNIARFTFRQYLKELKWTQERRHIIDEYTETEEIGIQLEMLIYLKFWEADSTIKKLYQLVRILHGKPYDWNFKISESNRDKGATGRRQDIIILEIREKIKSFSDILYKLFKVTYKTQIRNSIAHSNYSFLGRNIHLNNFIKEDKHSQLQGLEFNEWIDLFHNTIVLHNEMIRMSNLINEAYGKLSEKNGNLMEILITEKSGKQYPKLLEYRPDRRDWTYRQK